MSGSASGLALLASKRIIVTGAASGIGLGAAKAFGAEVLVNDLDGDVLAEAWPDLPADRRVALRNSMNPRQSK